MSNNNLPERDPKDWVTGGDAATDKQKGFVSKLAADKGMDVDASNMNKSEAAQQIESLKSTAGSSAGGSAGSSEGTIQNPESWTTGGDAATGAQARYIGAMASKAGEDIKTDGMSKAEASEKIEALKDKTGM